MKYTEMDEAAQISQVQALLPEILSKYGIKPRLIENVNHSYNSSFKITSDSGEEYALRINLGSGKSPNEILAEMQWLEALATGSDILAPVPVLTLEADHLVRTHFEPLDIETTAVIFKWIDGEEVGSGISNEQLFELGQNMAKLQLFAKNLEFKDPAHLPLINTTLMNSQDLITKGKPEMISDNLYELMMQALKLSDEVYIRLSKTEKLIPLHADLHAGNAIQTKDKLAVIDFDDAGIGLPIQDLAIATYYFREDLEKEKHLKAGFSSVTELPKISDEDYEALVTGRLILLINAVLGMTSAEIIEFLPQFLERSELRLKNYFNTGKLLLIKS